MLALQCKLLKTQGISPRLSEVSIAKTTDEKAIFVINTVIFDRLKEKLGFRKRTHGL